MEQTVILGHLCKEQMNAYGDSFNIQVLQTRLRERGIPVEVREYPLGEEASFTDCDLLYLGGGGQRETRLVLDFLRPRKELLREYLQCGGTMLATGSGYHIMGQSIPGEEDIPGLGLLDMTLQPSLGRSREVLAEGNLDGKPLWVLGWLEDLVSCTHPYPPLGIIREKEGERPEGLVTRHFIGTSLAGPVLAKNKDLADQLLAWALEGKYGKLRLRPLRDPLENLLKKKVIHEV